MIMLDNEKAFTAVETGAILKRTADTIKYHIRTGKLEAEKIGNAYYVKESAIKEYAQKRG